MTWAECVWFLLGWAGGTAAMLAFEVRKEGR